MSKRGVRVNSRSKSAKASFKPHEKIKEIFDDEKSSPLGAIVFAVVIVAVIAALFFLINGSDSAISGRAYDFSLSGQCAAMPEHRVADFHGENQVFYLDSAGTSRSTDPVSRSFIDTDPSLDGSYEFKSMDEGMYQLLNPGYSFPSSSTVEFWVYPTTTSPILSILYAKGSTMLIMDPIGKIAHIKLGIPTLLEALEDLLDSFPSIGDMLNAIVGGLFTGSFDGCEHTIYTDQATCDAQPDHTWHTPSDWCDHTIYTSEASCNAVADHVWRPAPVAPGACFGADTPGSSWDNQVDCEADNGVWFEMTGGTSFFDAIISLVDVFLGDVYITDFVKIAITDTPVQFNEWSHVAAVTDLNEGQIKLYVNGVQLANESADSFWTLDFDDFHVNLGNIDLGSGPIELFSFGGNIDELSLYSAALSPEQIMEIYEAGTEGKCVSETLSQCFDQIDNDGNGLTDCQDPACTGEFDIQFGSSGRFEVTLGGEQTCPGTSYNIELEVS